MQRMHKDDIKLTAEGFVQEFYPDCLCGILFGSAAAALRNGAGLPNDLDIFIILPNGAVAPKSESRVSDPLFSCFAGDKRVPEEYIEFSNNFPPSATIQWDGWKIDVMATTPELIQKYFNIYDPWQHLDVVANIVVSDTVLLAGDMSAVLPYRSLAAKKLNKARTPCTSENFENQRRTVTTLIAEEYPDAKQVLDALKHMFFSAFGLPRSERKHLQRNVEHSLTQVYNDIASLEDEVCGVHDYPPNKIRLKYFANKIIPAIQDLRLKPAMLPDVVHDSKPHTPI